MADITKEIDEFDIKRATKTVNALRVTRKQSDKSKTLTKVKQVFSFADPTSKKIQVVLKKIKTHVDDLYTRTGNINYLCIRYNPNWEGDPSDSQVTPNSIKNLSDLCEKFDCSAPSTEYYNYNEWFKDETKLIAEMKKHNLKYKDPMNMKVELWKILEDTEQIIKKQVEPWVELGKKVWEDPRFNGLYRKK